MLIFIVSILKIVILFLILNQVYFSNFIFLVIDLNVTLGKYFLIYFLGIK